MATEVDSIETGGSSRQFGPLRPGYRGSGDEEGLSAAYEVPYSWIMTNTTDTYQHAACGERQGDRFAQPDYRAHLRQLCAGWTQGNLFPEAPAILVDLASPTLAAALVYIERLLDELHVETVHSMKLAKMCFRLEGERTESAREPETFLHARENGELSVFHAHERLRDQTIQAAKDRVAALRGNFPEVIDSLVTRVLLVGEWGVGVRVQGRNCDVCCGVLVHLEPRMPITISDCWTCECPDAAQTLGNCFEFARRFADDLTLYSVGKFNAA